MAGEKCHFCGKTVYAAELRRYDGMVFHALCHGKWKKQQEAADSAKRNIEFVFSHFFFIFLSCNHFPSSKQVRQEA